MNDGLPTHLRQLADDSAQRWSDLMMDQPPTPSESFTLASKRASWAEHVMRQAADEIERLRSALEQIADQRDGADSCTVCRDFDHYDDHLAAPELADIARKALK